MKRVVSFQVQAAGSAAKAMGANVKLADTMATTTKTMGNMNKMMNPQQVAKTMQEFSMANTKMEMTEEMMNDTLDDILADSDDEAEQDAVVSQVLDEIGIEISGKVGFPILIVKHYLLFFQMGEAPSAGKGTIGAEAISKKNKEADDEIEKMLAQLKA